MGITTTKKRTATRTPLLAGLAAILALLGTTETAQAQEVQLTGPLAGAPAVRKLRLYREGRFEIAPAATFTLLDEYRRTIILGGRLTYNLTDWLGIGVWGGFGAIKFPTHLTDEIQAVNEDRRAQPNFGTSVDSRLTAVNLGPDFNEQLGSITWIVSPQLIGIPFRGKLALFKSIYVDTEMVFFAGPAFVGVKERKECKRDDSPDCTGSFETASRMAIAPSLGMGLSFFVNKWNAITADIRVTPFSLNIGGFDTAGGDPNGDFPNNSVTDKDRQFRFNMMATVGYSFYLPLDHHVSE
jgi:hypothetical protein